jgi:hypothetical protein
MYLNPESPRIARWYFADGGGANGDHVLVVRS